MTDTPAERGVESTWTRLRRRKVVQWGLVYVPGAWGFLAVHLSSRAMRRVEPRLPREPEFKAVFADIERDMAKQPARPKDAPLDLADKQ